MDGFGGFDFSNQAYKDFEKIFIDSHFSRKEIGYISAINEISTIIDGLVNIPSRVSKKVTKTVLIGEDEVPHEISEFLEYDTYSEKAKSILQISNLDKLEETLRKRLEAEYKHKKSNGRTMFDS